MAATVGTSGSGDPDMALVSELLEEISRHPPAIGAMKLLVEHYISVGWLDAAMENAKELKRLAPLDAEVSGFLEILERKPQPPAPTPAPAPKRTSAATKPAGKPVKRKPISSSVHLPGNLDSTRQEFAKSYTALRSKAKVLLGDMLHLQALQKKNGLPQSKISSRLQAIVDGRSEGTMTTVAGPPGSARSVARIIQTNSKKGTEIAIADLEDMMRWVREPHGKPSGADDDAIRDAMVKRMRALESALPDDLKFHTELALMHVEHENLKRNYVNDETMLGDMVKDIPRENFYVTEDNYAWDMEELAQAITANGGVMRNPLSKIMFTQKDIKGIVTHPHGKALAALQVEQAAMSKGVRPETIAKMEELSRILLEDQSPDSLPSRHAVDEFMAYSATRKSTATSSCSHKLIDAQSQSSNKKSWMGSGVPQGTATPVRPTTSLLVRLCATPRGTEFVSTRRATSSSKLRRICVKIKAPRRIRISVL